MRTLTLPLVFLEWILLEDRSLRSSHNNVGSAFSRSRGSKQSWFLLPWQAFSMGGWSGSLFQSQVQQGSRHDSCLVKSRVGWVARPHGPQETTWLLTMARPLRDHMGVHRALPHEPPGTALVFTMGRPHSPHQAPRVTSMEWPHVLQQVTQKPILEVALGPSVCRNSDHDGAFRLSRDHSTSRLVLCGQEGWTLHQPPNGPFMSGSSPWPDHSIWEASAVADSSLGTTVCLSSSILWCHQKWPHIGQGHNEKTLNHIFPHVFADIEVHSTWVSDFFVPVSLVSFALAFADVGSCCQVALANRAVGFPLAEACLHPISPDGNHTFSSHLHFLHTHSNGDSMTCKV